MNWMSTKLKLILFYLWQFPQHVRNSWMDFYHVLVCLELHGVNLKKKKKCSVHKIYFWRSPREQLNESVSGVPDTEE